MVQHLPRQVRWIQQQSVAHFPTHVQLQLHREPFADMAGAQVMAITASDRFSFAPQWIAFIMAALAVSLVAQECGAGGRGQLLAALIAITYPVAFLQASNQKNDLVFAMWFCILTWQVCRLWGWSAWGARWTMLLGCNVGLLVLTKATAYFIPAPLYFLAAVGLWRRYRCRAIWSGLVIVIFAILIPLGHYSRNWNLYGNPIGPKSDMSNFANRAFTPAAIASRIIREAGLHIATPFPRLNDLSLRAILRIHRWLGYDINDPGTTSPNAWIRFFVIYTPGDENMAQAPVHLLVALALPALAFWRRREVKSQLFWILLPTSYASFLLVCLFLKWDFTYGVRVHMAVFFLWGALAGVLFGLKHLRLAAFALVAIVALEMIPTMWLSPRSLAPGRGIHRPAAEQLLSANPEFRQPSVLQSFVHTAAKVKQYNPAVVGLLVMPEWFEYSIMRLLSDGDPFRPRFVSVNVTNESARTDSDYPTPGVIIAGSPILALTDNRTGLKYKAAREYSPWTILLPSDDK